jgi:hypothetical protein
MMLRIEIPYWVTMLLIAIILALAVILILARKRWSVELAPTITLVLCLMGLGGLLAWWLFQTHEERQWIRKITQDVEQTLDVKLRNLDQTDDITKRYGRFLRVTPIPGAKWLGFTLQFEKAECLLHLRLNRGESVHILGLDLYPHEQWRRMYPKQAGQPEIIDNRLYFVDEQGRSESMLHAVVSHPDIPIPARSVRFENYLLPAAPALIGPAILGAIIWLKCRRRELGRLSAVFTLKPIIATPFWAAILAILANPRDSDMFFVRSQLPLAYFLTVLPGVGLTLAIVAVFWSLFFRSRSEGPFLLLVLDCFRWSITIIGPLIWRNSSSLALALCLACTAEAFPTLYGIVAFVIAARDGKRSHSATSHDGQLGG